MNEQCCCKCIFFHAFNQGDEPMKVKGECRCNPPTAFPLLSPGVVGGQPKVNFLMFQPQVTGDYCCGKYQSAEL